MSWLRRGRALLEQFERRFGLGAPARTHAITPDQNGVVALGNAIPAAIGHDPCTKRRAHAVKPALRQASRQLLDSADVEIVAGVQAQLEMRRDAGNKDGSIGRNRLQHHEREAFEIGRMNKQRRIAVEHPQLGGRQGAGKNHGA